MIIPHSLAGKKVAILGLGKSGLFSAKSAYFGGKKPPEATHQGHSGLFSVKRTYFTKNTYISLTNHKKISNITQDIVSYKRSGEILFQKVAYGR